MSDIEWRWVSAGFISGGGTSEKEPHFKKDWVSFLIEVTEFELTYMLRANDRGYDDLPEFPLSHHGMEDIKAAQAERITPILNDGHYIRGKGKIVDDNIMWSNFAKGTPGGDKDETINQTFSEVEFTIWPGDRFGELRVSRPEYRDEPYRLLANLQLPQTRIDSLAEMAHRYGADARMKISLLASLFYLSLIHISEPTRLGMISYAVFCLKKKNTHLRAHETRGNLVCRLLLEKKKKKKKKYMLCAV